MISGGQQSGQIWKPSRCASNASAFFCSRSASASKRSASTRLLPDGSELIIERMAVNVADVASAQDLMVTGSIMVLGGMVIVFDCKLNAADTLRNHVVNPTHHSGKWIANDTVNEWHENINDAHNHLTRNDQNDTNRNEKET